VSIAALSSAGSIPDAAAPQKVTPPSAEVRIVDTRDRPTIDRTAALVKDEYQVSSYSNPSIDGEEMETEGLSVYA